MIRRPDRRIWATVILAGWVGGMIVLASRNHDVPEAQLLASGALRLEPATYFYTVSQGESVIGSASSSIDTTRRGLTAREVARVRGVFGADGQIITAMSTAYLSRGFALDSFAFTVSSGSAPVRIRGRPAQHAGVLLPTLAPIAMMLAASPRVGERTDSWIYNPVARRVERVTLAIAAESVLRVVDSAAFDSARALWVPSHTDTIRSWKIATPSNSVWAWVDSQGRLVAAQEAGGARLARTAYEIATLNQKSAGH